VGFDWVRCVERNTDTLTAIVAKMFVMARIAPGEAVGSDPCERTLPRYVWRAVMLLLVPAESAMRRLIIIAARGLVFEGRLPLRKPAGISASAAADVSPGADASASSEAGACSETGESADAADIAGASETGDASQGVDAASRAPLFNIPVFNMFDPMKSFEDYYRAELDPDSIQPFPASLPDPVRCAPVGAVTLWRRLQALHFAVQDMPGSVQRYLRFLARRNFSLQTNTPLRPRRIGLMRGGYAPGYQKNKRDRNAAHDLLRDVHLIAFDLLSPPKHAWSVTTETKLDPG
jgi:hypothetical protein